jgi:hypothetical protein
MHVTHKLLMMLNGKTLAYVTTVGQKQSGTMVERAAWVGKEIAVKLKKLKLIK